MTIEIVTIIMTKRRYKTKTMSNNRANFGSKLGMILATAGSAVGLGNIWRFPYMTGQNGGAAFIFIYIICVFLLGLPCMVNEFIIGRHAQSNTARAYWKLGNGKPWWAIIGYLGVMTGFLITGYYSVVAGWCFEYIFASASGKLNGSPEFFADYFSTFEKDPIKPVFWAVAFLIITHYIISHGVRGGIEKASKLLMPALFIILLILVVSSCMLPNAYKGIEYLFKPDFSKVTKDVFLGALGQAFYSMSVGMGCLCTFASYYSRETNLTRSAVQIGVIDTVVAILAGLLIFPAAFSIGVNPDSGPSLIFITLPNVFQQAFAHMPAVGYVVAISFYGLLSLAALTSLISLHEVSTAFFQEELKISRQAAATIVTVICGIIAALCSLSLGGADFLNISGKSLFDILDFLTGQIMLPFGGFLTCIFVGWYMKKQIIRNEYTNYGAMPGKNFHIYLFCVKYLCPILIALVFIHQFGII